MINASIVNVYRNRRRNRFGHWRLQTHARELSVALARLKLLLKWQQEKFPDENKNSR